MNGHYKIDHRLTCQDRDRVSVLHSPYDMIYSKTGMACYIQDMSSRFEVHIHSDDKYPISFAHRFSS